MGFHDLDFIFSVIHDAWSQVEGCVVIATHIWQKLSNIECEVTLIVMDLWQAFSQISGETLLIVTNFGQIIPFLLICAVMISSI